MTCIVGLVHNGEVWMGGDSFCERSNIVYHRATPKVFTRENPHTGLKLLLGSSGEAFVSQMLQYEIEIPACLEGQDGNVYMGREFGHVALNAIGKHLRILKKKVWPSFSILAGYDGRLYSIDSNCYVMHEDSGLIAIGWGDEIAMGALEATPELDPQERIRRALSIASKRTGKVAPPFHIEKL